MVTRADLVKEFYTAAEVKHPVDTHVALIREEAKEVREAVAALLKEMADFQYVVTGAAVQGVQPSQLPDELVELINTIMPLFAIVPEELLDEAFRRVHASNMSKLVDGKPLRDPETGKILKGPNYKKPDLSDLV